jgi:hypothetical protein
MDRCTPEPAIQGIILFPRLSGCYQKNGKYQIGAMFLLLAARIGHLFGRRDATMMT